MENHEINNLQSVCAFIEHILFRIGVVSPWILCAVLVPTI